jgi:hypothetical protein
VKSTINTSQVWVTPGEWSFERDPSGGAKEYNFQRKGADLHAMIINEAIEIPLDNLAEIALANAKAAAGDMRIVKKEFRKVNGKNVIFM